MAVLRFHVIPPQPLELRRLPQPTSSSILEAEDVVGGSVRET